MNDIPADRINSTQYMKAEIQDLQQENRKLKQELGTLWELVERQDREIQYLKRLNQGDGK